MNGNNEANKVHALSVGMMRLAPWKESNTLSEIERESYSACPSRQLTELLYAARVMNESNFCYVQSRIYDRDRVESTLNDGVRRNR